MPRKTTTNRFRSKHPALSISGVKYARKTPLKDGDVESCPVCKSNWVGSRIPERYRPFYGHKTNFSRLIGIEVLGVYDGVLYWQCPDCHANFKRFPWS